MGTEHFYWFVDRAVVDPLLEMNWKAFLRKYPWRGDPLEELLDLVLNSNRQGLAPILARRSLRWTMRHSRPAYYFLNEIVHHVPKVRRRCPEVWGPLYETAVLVAAAYEAFLQGQIDQKILWAVYNITGSEDPRQWLQLARSELAQVECALGCGAVEKPIFPWQTDECLKDGYRCLRSADTMRFITFLKRAAEENWPAPRIRSHVRRRLNWPNQNVPRFRDFGLPRELTRRVKTSRFERPYALRYFG